MKTNTGTVSCNEPVSYYNIFILFLKTGAFSFGGWSTTILLLEKEVANNFKKISIDLKNTAAYAQILPGATQVAIVSNVGYQMRGFKGASLATLSYLIPAISLMILFAWVYFTYMQQMDVMDYFKGLIPALAGIILANAYRIGSRHVTHPLMWFLVIIACLSLLVFKIHALLVIVSFGLCALIISLITSKKSSI